MRYQQHSSPPILLYILIGLVYILCTITIVDGNRSTAKLLQSSYEIKDSLLLGGDVQLLSGKLEFDQPLFRLDGNACPNVTCSPPICICDYTYANTVGCGIPSCIVSCPLKTEVCDTPTNPGYNYTLLTQFNYDYNITTPASPQLETRAYFRFNIKGNNCNGYKLRIRPMQGKLDYAQFRVGVVGPITKRFDFTQQIMEYVLCPSDLNVPTGSYPTGSYGTYFLEVVNTQSIDAIYTITIDSFSVPSTKTGVSCQSPNPSIPCLNDGQAPSLSDPQVNTSQISSFTIYKCSNITIGQAFANSIYYGDIYVKIDDDNVSLTNFDYYSPNITNKQIIFQLCPDVGKSNITIYILYVNTMDQPIQSALFVTTNGEMRVISLTDTSVPLRIRQWMLDGTSYFQMPNNTNSQLNYRCDSNGLNCRYYFPTAPRYFNTPLYPVPQVFINEELKDFINIQITETDNPIQTNQYQYGLLISSNYYHFIVSPNYINTIKFQLGSIKMLNNIVDAKGDYIEGLFSIGEKTEENCKRLEFIQADKDQNDIVSTVETSVNEMDLNNNRYKFDLYLLRNNYYLCDQLAQSMINYKTVVTTPITMDCDNPVNYTTNPCCSYPATFNSSCLNHPSLSIRRRYVSANMDKVNDMCSSPDCVQSILANYAQTTFLKESQSCQVQLAEIYSILDPMYVVFRKCKELTLEPVNCITSAQCQNGTCNPRTGTCDTPYYITEVNFILCLLDKLPNQIKADYINQAGLGNADNAQIAAVVQSVMKGSDCTSYNNIERSIRSSYNYLPPSGVMPHYSYPGIVSLDKSDTSLLYDTIYQGSIPFTWQYKNQSTQCSNLKRCNWMGSSGTIDKFNYDVSALTAACNNNPPSGFCGECSDPLRGCFVNSTITDATTCGNRAVCIIANRKNRYQLYVDPPFSSLDSQFVTVPNIAACNNFGSCSVPCGYKCSSTFTCMVPIQIGSCPPNKMSAPLAKEYTYKNGTKYCIYTSNVENVNFSESMCTVNNGIYTKCGSLSTDTCTMCGMGDSYVTCGCQLEEIKCRTPLECQNAPGVCSDNVYYMNQIGDYPAGQPKCVVNYTVLPSRVAVLPVCKIGELDSPMGCWISDPQAAIPTRCAQYGGTLVYPITDPFVCNTTARCSSIDRSKNFVPPVTTRYSLKSQQECNFGADEWVTPYRWISPRWIPAQGRPLQWFNTSSQIGMTPVAYVNSTLTFDRLFDAFYNSTFHRLSLTYKSEMVCRSSTTKSTLKSIACSCSVDRDDDEDCFDESAETTDFIVKPCTGSNLTQPIGDSEGFIQFGVDPGPKGKGIRCSTVGIGQIFADEFIAKQVVALASDFAPVVKVEDYSLFNDHEGPIAQIIASGVILHYYDRNIDSIYLCLNQTEDSKSDKYDIYDFALLTDQSKGTIQPLELDLNEIDDQFCSNISQSLILPPGNGSNTVTILLVLRMENWRDEPKRIMTAANQIALYVLATIFMIPFLIGFTQVLFVMYQRYIIKTERFKLVHLLFVFLTIFTLIRAIYFYLLPSSKFQDNANVLDYVMVVSPTFLYFTSFTIVIVIWYILSNDSLKNVGNIYRRINRLVIGINVLLYLLFIGIVLVFNFYIAKPPTSCGGRILTEYANTTPQVVVSILYATVQAALSLVLGVAFIYYGKKVIAKLTQFSVKLANAKHQKRKTMTMALLCSIGFLLHCIFIIILVTKQPRNIVFTFIGLVVTEIIPVMTLLLTYTTLPIHIPFLTAKYNNPLNGSTKQKGDIELTSSSNISSSTSTTRSVRSSGFDTNTNTLSNSSN